MKRESYVVLQITCWAGLSFGAEHFYGKLSGYVNGEYKTQELEKVMTLKVARALSKKHDWEYKAGNQTQCFDTKDEVRSVALAEWRKIFPDAKALLEGNSSSAEPMKCLWIKNTKHLNRLTEIFKENEKIPHTDKNWKKIDALCDEFYKLLETASK